MGFDASWATYFSLSLLQPGRNSTLFINTFIFVIFQWCKFDDDVVSLVGIACLYEAKLCNMLLNVILEKLKLRLAGQQFSLLLLGALPLDAGLAHVEF